MNHCIWNQERELSEFQGLPQLHPNYRPRLGCMRLAQNHSINHITKHQKSNSEILLCTFSFLKQNENN